MRKFYFIIAIFFITNFAYAGGGIYETYMSFSLNGNPVFYHGTGGGNPTLNGATLASNLDLNSNTLVLRLRGLNSWNDNGCDVTSAKMNYRIYKNSDPAPSFIPLDLTYQSTSGNNKFWNTNSPDIDLLTGVTTDGTYNFEVYFEISTNTLGSCAPIIYENNGGANFIGTFSVSTALPVKFQAFEVNRKSTTNQLSWSTASEINSDFFEIHSSRDGVIFDNIGLVKSLGNGRSINNYQFIDKNPLVGISYYRLKQVDFDGRFEYSAIKEVNFDIQNEIHVYPNPTSNILIIDKNDSPADISLINLAGQQYIHLQNSTVKSIDLSQLPAGMYLLNIISDSKSFQHKIYKTE